jgi:crotonobetainyl-CoA:carnitine CoA-transferase CaiB-like acyl-CoA transferase
METRPPSLLPEQFGPLQGVRILSTGSLIAQPYAASLAAEMGAEVIQIERPGEGDAAWRHLGRQLPTTDGQGKAATTWIQERRNALYTTLDFSKPEGREVFLKLIKVCDIWMESSKPGSYAKWGLTDDVVLQANAKIVIAHVSGYGQTGHPDSPTRTRRCGPTLGLRITLRRCFVCGHPWRVTSTPNGPARGKRSIFHSLNPFTASFPAP